MKKKKILFITNKAPSYRIPLFNELAKIFDIRFLFTHEKNRIDGLNVSYELLKGIGYKKFKIHFSLIKELKNKQYDQVVMLPPDPLHLIDNLLVYWILKKKKIPFTFYVGRWKYKNKPLKQILTEPIQKRMLRRSKSCICYGSKSRSWLISQGVAASKIFISYNINPKIYLNLKSLNQSKNKKKTVLYVGRLIKRKGVDYLIKGFSKINNANLIIVGGGDFYKLEEKSIEHKLKQLVNDLNIQNKVSFVGEIHPEQAKNYYKNADLFVYPSVTESVGEAWGHAIEEAMSFGLPIITTDATGAEKDLIKEGINGFIVKEKNAEALYQAIKKIINSKKMIEKMGKMSKKIISQNKFSFNSIIKGFEKALY